MNQIQKIRHIILYDVYRGLKSNKYRYVICAFLIFSLLFTFNYNVYVRSMADSQIPYPGIMDNVFYLLSGISKIVNFDPSKFVFPYVWITVQFMCAFLVLNYLNTDMEGIGLDILLRSKSRRLWWLSKCIWNACTVASLYLMIGVFSILFALRWGSLNITIHYEIFNKTSDIASGNQVEVLLFLLLMPLLASIAISILQMSLSLLVGPVISLIIIFSLDVLSVFYMVVFLPGNDSMVLRSRVFAANGLPVVPGAVFCILLLCMCCIVGVRAFQKIDIIEKDAI